MHAPLRAWIFDQNSSTLPLVDVSISGSYLADEAECVRLLIEQARLPRHQAEQVTAAATDLVAAMRRNRDDQSGLDAFMSEYDLSSDEGIVLMCLAEALLRIPDTETADRLIADKLGAANWQDHLGSSDSVLVNASTWALMLTGRLVQDSPHGGFVDALAHMAGRAGEPVIRAALKQAMSILGSQFVIGRTIEHALQRASQDSRYRHSFDMLGEAALTAADADRYLEAYADAIRVIGARAGSTGDVMAAPGISVKLSALNPRVEFAQAASVLPELTRRLRMLALLAADAGIGMTVDAEEADRLELALAVFEQVLGTRGLRDWPGFGLAVQAYQKRAWSIITWLNALARAQGRVIPVRLVKGAYWDTEIKRAQEQGLSGYPVFTRKSNTDVSYLACAKALLNASPRLYPQFATHNAHTVAWILQQGTDTPFEFQRLHGMGEELYSEIIGAQKFDRPCRVYAPVGLHEDLLPYLVRRLLENGANTSFVNRFVHADCEIEDIVADPVTISEGFAADLTHPRIPLPANIFAPARRNSAGVNLNDYNELKELARALANTAADEWRSSPIVDGERLDGAAATALDPFDRDRSPGSMKFAGADTATLAVNTASAYRAEWNMVPAHGRAALLRKIAERFQAGAAELISLLVRDAGRTVADALAELRESIDFLRYYAGECERLFAYAASLPGPTGEHNEVRLSGRGVFLCISPWNFPLSIFTGQLAAALAAGNTVIAKPAEQTSIIAARAAELMFESGLPTAALQFLPGPGPLLGSALMSDPRIAGVAFTGAHETAQAINRTLAQRPGPIAAFIAETGGVNAMIADSSALTEQVVNDAVQSAFNSAGQRCSALRLLCLPESTAEPVLSMLRGRMAELVIGDPALLATDVGPVIDSRAQRKLVDYLAAHVDRIVYQCPLPGAYERGFFVSPTLIEVDHVADLTHEVFGPILHVVRYQPNKLDALVDTINAVGFGLTLGIHSRIDSFARRIAQRARVGNIYINRNMIGAQVGVQPFGGMGLSGTGPKAGGPHYLLRFATEQTVTINTAAIGGNAALLSLGSDDVSAR